MNVIVNENNDVIAEIVATSCKIIYSHEGPIVIGHSFDTRLGCD